MNASDEPLRRFYKTVKVAPADGDLHRLTLDDRPLRTPGRNALAVPRPVADAMAAEWDAQTDVIRPLTMPMTRLVNSAIDGVARAREEVAADIAKIAGGDLVLYRAEAPAGLVARQAAEWDPVVAFTQDTLAVPLRLADGIMPVRQDERLGPAVLAALPDAPLPLAAMHQLTTLTGSAFLALAVLAEHLTLGQAWQAAHVDEDWNIAEWGEDAEAMARRAARWDEAQAADIVLRAPPGP